MSKVKVLVLAGYGLNCDYETAYTFELAGAKAKRVHINSLIGGDISLSDFNILVFTGGFGWGDDHGAGVVQSVKLKTKLGDTILEFVDKGNLVIGICNGFQAIVNMGLLPGFDNNYTTRSLALTFNDCGNFKDCWVDLKVNNLSPCVFTKGLDNIELPIRHGEGKFYSDESTIKRLVDNNQVVVRYAMPEGKPANGKYPYNPNGSVEDIAGICDPSGRIFGLMPHPEAYNHFTNHPDWTRRKEKLKRLGENECKQIPTGILIFKNAVDYIMASQ
ncbi:MAG: phosphoribosylformylglycinamidine synthase I [Proteobacteria bacterium]|nr:phosphoribosylformylglycinamidine synthase I [Pseudomonadota bacterium]